MENEKSLVRLYFGDTYKACKKSEAMDDRGLFVNCVDNLMSALDAMKTVTHSMIKIAFHVEFDKEIEELKSLEASLKQRKMV